MSYESMAKEEVSCDFPGCGSDFYSAPEARVAIIKDGQILAFCRKDSDRLIAEGVELRTLHEIHTEQKEAREAPARLRREREQIAREREFIQSLK